MARPVSQHSQQGMNRSVTPREARSGSVNNMSNPSGSNQQANGNVNAGQAQGPTTTPVQGQQDSPRNPPTPMQSQT